MGKRYTVLPHMDVRGFLRYMIVDTSTGKAVGEQDCYPWAERRAEELNAKRRKNNERKADNGNHL